MIKALVIEHEAVENNLKIIKTKAGTSTVIGVLKGNAYGFGLIEMARMMRDEGIYFFAVTEPSDLVKLRDAGFNDESVLMLRSTALPSEIETIIDCDGIATIGSYEAATAANALAEQNGTVLSVHIAIDTGMGRYGFLPSEENKIVSVFRYKKNLHVTGMYTHYSNAYVPGKRGERLTRKQYESFMKTVQYIRNAGFDPGILHSANTPALFRFPYTHLDAVRIGSAYTGRLPGKSGTGLRKTGYGESQIIDIRWLEKGCTVGYGSDYKARGRTKIAIIPIGYADGFCVDKSHDIYKAGRTLIYMLRELKKGLKHETKVCEIRGKRCKVLGKIGMLHTVCDITDVECEIGDLAKFEVNPLIAGNILPKRYI